MQTTKQEKLMVSENGTVFFFFFFFLLSPTQFHTLVWKEKQNQKKSVALHHCSTAFPLPPSHFIYTHTHTQRKDIIDTQV